MPDVAVIIALVLSSGSLVVSIASFVLAISTKWQAKKAATLGFRVEAINHLRAMLSDIDRGGVTSRTVDTIHDARRSTELVFSRDVRERLHRASAAIFRLNTATARGKAQCPQDIVGLRHELQTDLHASLERAAWILEQTIHTPTSTAKGLQEGSRQRHR
jgi:hypothetical protein